MRMKPIFRFLLLPAALLALGVGCSHGSSSSNSAPAITTQPQAASVVSGRPVSFSVTITGATPLTIQWAKDGIDILGAHNSTLTLSNPGLQDAGQYTVTATNSLGSATSAPATLTVTQALNFTSPVSVVADASGDLFVSDMDNHAIWKVDPSHQKTLLAGSPGLPGSADGQGSNAQFRNPGGIAFDPSGNLVVADTGNHTIRSIAPDGTVTTLAGSPGLPGSTDGVGSLARFNAPVGIAVDANGTTYIADSQNHTIRKLATDGTVTTFAGAAGQPGLADGTGASARFNQPNGLALGPNGTLYVADYGNSCIRMIASGAQVTTLAGQASTHGYADGTSTAALFYLPVGITVDSSGIVWVADTHNHAIRRITPDGTVVTLAGTGGTAGNVDGLGNAALFDLPCGIATTPSGSLIVADTGNHLLRSITSAGEVSTLTVP